MATYSIAEAERKLSALVDEANAGEPVTLTREGKPVAELKPVAPPRGTVTPEMLDFLASVRALWPGQPVEDAVMVVRKMRDEVR
jgi:prevent-host-death family protein